jgi:2-polyprenyl-3-methyl-5-hydroxy-6-metoxy-1,4-benzoquinol methylase
LHDRIFGIPGEWTLRRCIDRQCGLLWLDPMPIEEDLPGLYHEYYTHSERGASKARFRRAIQQAYWQSHFGSGRRGDLLARTIAAFVSFFPGLRLELAQQVFELSALEEGRLLDVGCGSGAGMRRMADLGWHVEGVDFDEKALQLAASNGLQVRLGSLEEQNYPAGSFDAVVMSHVLEHVWDPSKLLGECHRILKPGGRLVCITPNAASWCHGLFKGDWRGLEPPRHLHIFTRQSLSRLVQSTGWMSLEIRSTIASTHYMAWSSGKLKINGSYSVQMRPSILSEIAARAFQMVAAARNRFDPQSGEELVMHAVKAM